MNGIVDADGRALVEVVVRPSPNGKGRALSVWIDTGFTGELVVPSSIIDELDLKQSAIVNAVLADGSAVGMQTHTCYIEWFGKMQRLEAVANQRAYPLLGVGLLLDRELRVDYRTRVVSIG